MSLINYRNEDLEGLYLYGSGEMDQLSPLKEEEKNADLFDTKIPLKIPIHFISLQEKIKLIKCGQMFTMILSTEGNLYTFGCSDNGGIGHEDSIPAKKVNINFKATGISGGDCHGIAYNENNLAFWGQFRNSQGGMGEPCLNINYYNNSHIQYEHFKKVISGTNHVLILSKEKNIFAFGNKEFGQRGLDPKTNISHLTINKINEENIEDIFTGDDHSFLMKYEKNNQIIKSWGLNNKGQLGLGTSAIDGNENISIYTPTKINFPYGVKIKKISGGSATSICLTEDNRIFVWGGNDDDILGLNLGDDGRIVNTPKELIFFNRNSNPDNEVDEIVATYRSFYARNKQNNKVYSWGSGDSYILGNKKEKAEKKPYLIDSKFYKNLRVTDLDMGCSHVAVVLTKDERLYNIENIIKTENKKATYFENKNKPIKRRNDNLPDEEGNNLNLNMDNYDNFAKLKKYIIREENISLNIKDRPKTKSIIKGKIPF